MSRLQDRSCPECGHQMVFSGDGRSLACERCGHGQKIEAPERSTPQQIVKERRYRDSVLGGSRLPGIVAFTMTGGDSGGQIQQQVARQVAQQRQISRDLLVRGVAAAKSGDLDEAHFYLAKLLRIGGDEDQEVKAWLWLSETYEAPADKRVCLEEALAIQPTNPVARRGMAILDGRLQEADIINPDQLVQASPDEPLAAKAQEFRCPQCAARMNFVADGQTIRCDFCGYTDTPDAIAANPEQQTFGIGEWEQDFVAALAQAKGHLQPIAMRVLQCQGCAIEFTLVPETLSLTCPYCDSVYVTESAETRDIMPPQAIIPFAIDLNAAEQALRRWFKQHGIDRPRVSPIVGIYLPVWTFDASGEIKWGGQVRRGDAWVQKSGFNHFIYDDILVPAGNELSPQLSQGFTDFALDGLVAYDARYLADWPAERYQLPLADASIQARRQIVRELRRNPSPLTQGEAVRNLRLNSTGLTVESFKLILLPEWIAHYQFEGKMYDIVINGQTGVVYGERPQGMVGKFMAWLKGA